MTETAKPRKPRSPMKVDVAKLRKLKLTKETIMKIERLIRAEQKPKPAPVSSIFMNCHGRYD